jgi:spore coat polysaccharide biosynthesis protein SpsF (cytidylyltransferase family)
MSHSTNSIALIDLGCQQPAASGRGLSPFRRVGRQTLLEWTIRRLSDASLLDAIAIVGDSEFSGLITRSHTQPAQWFPCNAELAAERAWYVAQELSAEWVVMIPPTAVFVDPVLIDRVLAAAWAAPKSDAVGFVSAHNPALSMEALGLAGDVCHRRTLKRLVREGFPAGEQRPLSQLIRSMPEAFHTRLVPLPSTIDRAGARFGLESESDLDRALMILDASGDDCDYCDLAHIASHFE